MGRVVWWALLCYFIDVWDLKLDEFGSSERSNGRDPNLQWPDCLSNVAPPRTTRTRKLDQSWRDDGSDIWIFWSQGHNVMNRALPGCGMKCPCMLPGQLSSTLPWGCHQWYTLNSSLGGSRFQQVPVESYSYQLIERTWFDLIHDCWWLWWCKYWWNVALLGLWVRWNHGWKPGDLTKGKGAQGAQISVYFSYHGHESLA